MPRLISVTSRLLRRTWCGLRDWCGDSAYETYLRAARNRKVQTPLSRREFYVDQLNRRYSRPSRCC
jgi:uncharacterized short protein YbdD (DUF466 family)